MKDLRHAVDLAVRSRGGDWVCSLGFCNVYLREAVDMKDVCRIRSDLLCLPEKGLFKDLLEWRRERESTACYFWRSACDAQELWLGVNWQVSTERCYVVSNHTFNRSTVEQQRYFCTNAKCCGSPEKEETLLGPGAHSFHMCIPAELVVNVNIQLTRLHFKERLGSGSN